MADADDFDWDDLRYFLRAAQAGTLAGAARATGVRHTTVGRRLSALERAFGAPLFLRGPDGLKPTPLGDKLVTLAREVERNVEAARALAAGQRDRVRVAVPSGLIALFADDLARFGERHPSIAIEIMSGGRLVDLRRGEADMALRVGPIADEDLVARKLGEFGASLYASRTYLEKHPASTPPENLTGHLVIAYGADLAAQPAAQWLDAHAAGATIVMRSNEIATMIQAAASGVGVALLPCFMADAEPALVRLTPRILARRGISLVYRREQRQSAASRSVARFLVEAMARRAGRIAGAG